MVDSLEWYGAEQFRKEELKGWGLCDAQSASASDSEAKGVKGLFKSSGDLTFLTIYGAGHMVRNTSLKSTRLHSKLGRIGSLR